MGTGVLTVEVKMGKSWFVLTRGQCSRSRKSYRVHGLNGYQTHPGTLNYWVMLLLLHS